MRNEAGSGAKAFRPRYLRPCTGPWHDSPKLSGRAMTEDGPVSAGENRCHPFPLQADSPMPDRVDPTVNGMQLSSLQSPVDSARTEAKVQELKTSHDPMLLFRQGRHRASHGTRAAFASTEVLNAGRPRHPMIVRLAGALVALEKTRMCNAKEAPARRYRLWL